MAPSKLGPAMGVTSTTTSAGLAVATSSTGADPGGRSSFALNPFGALPAARSHPSGSTSKDDDAKVDADIPNWLRRSPANITSRETARARRTTMDLMSRT